MKTIYIITLSWLVLQHTFTSLASAQRMRSKRFVPVLIFPPTSPTRVQFIGGIGIPLPDLNYEALTTGYIFKAEYQIPFTAESLWTTTQLPVNLEITTSLYEAQRKFTKQPLFENFLVGANELKQSPVKWLHKHKPVLTNYRWVIYKGLEGLANRLGMAGRECVLKSICEAAEEPFHYESGIFAELLYILLTPSSSVDELSEHADNEYFYAESIGRSGTSCERVFKACPISLLSRISKLHDLMDTFENFM